MSNWKPALTPEQVKPQNAIEAFTLALRLAVSAPTDEQSQKALKLAKELSSSLTKEQVDEVKAKLEVETAQ